MRYGPGGRASVAGWKKASESFRLRLHSGLRQRGSIFDAVFYGTAEAVPLRGFCVDARVFGGGEGWEWSSLR
jgi:hypothetical protein